MRFKINDIIRDYAGNLGVVIKESPNLRIRFDTQNLSQYAHDSDGSTSFGTEPNWMTLESREVPLVEDTRDYLNAIAEFNS